MSAKVAATGRVKTCNTENERERVRGGRRVREAAADNDVDNDDAKDSRC